MDDENPDEDDVEDGDMNEDEADRQDAGLMVINRDPLLLLFVVAVVLVLGLRPYESCGAVDGES